MATEQLDQLEQNSENYYKPKNKKERIARRLVWDRYRTMRDDPLRKEAEEQWDRGDKMFLQWSEGRHDGDWRAHVTLPDGFAAVQTHMQETIERRSRPILKPVEVTDTALELFGNCILNHNMDTTGYDYQDYLAKQTAAIRGTSFMMEYYRIDKREIQDLDSVDDDGSIIYKKKIVTDFEDTYTEFIDNEFIFLDPGTPDQNLLRDMVYREIIDFDSFQRSYKLRADFMNVDKVPKAGLVSDQARFFDRTEDITDDQVEVLHYYNREIDAYYVVANNVLIRMTPLPFKHKELPVAVHVHYNVPGRLYGLGIPYVIFSLTEERKSLRNLNLDRQHLNGDKMFLVNDLVDLDEEDARTRPHGLIPVNTNGLRLPDVIMPIEYGDTPISYYKAEEMLLEDIRRAHGIDDRLQGNNMGGTATEAAILKEASQRRINLINMLAEMNTIIRIGRLKWSNIQFFYPSGRAERIVEASDEPKKVLRTIRVTGRQFDVVKDNGTGKTSLRFDDIDGESSFKLNKKMASFMNNEWDVTIDAEGHGVLSKPLKQAKITEMFNMLSQNPQLMGVLDPTKAAKRYLIINEEDPKAWLRENTMSTDEWRTLAMHENIVMAKGTMLDPTPNAPTNHTEVHLDFMNSSDYDLLIQQQPGIKDIFERHVFGENDNNPELATDQQGAQTTSGGGVGGGAGAAGGGAGVPVADLQPNGVGGEGNPAQPQV
jgi:hypothetical protein